MSDHQDIFTELISSRYNLPASGVRGTIRLLSEGGTVPFISRYRKEVTGALDEQQVGLIKDQLDRLTELQKRKETILSTIEEQGKLTGDIESKIKDCFDSSELEDLYLPFKPKRRTRATAAKELGLEPLAALIMRQDGSDPRKLAERFMSSEVIDTDSALAGAMDIIAEWVNESVKSRVILRRLYEKEGIIVSKVIKGKEREGDKYSDYFESSEQVKRIPSHRMLAMLRGEKEGFLRVSANVDEEKAVEQILRLFIRGNSTAKNYIEKAIRDGYKRLLSPSISSEIISLCRERAEKEAINVFTENLRQLLLSPPLSPVSIMGIDPGFRSGCKIVFITKSGEVLDHGTIYPHPPQNKIKEAESLVLSLTKKYGTEAVAIGDGTAGRETEKFITGMSFENKMDVYMVSEDGASVYSASPAAREEFPDFDVTVRGAVSIGRRLLDPLAELVKIDPKAIGVGQYQHDVDQNKLKRSLDSVVESCVNRVGVNLNTASWQLLSYVAGLGESLARNIVKYRNENGLFTSRKELLKIPRLGAKAYEQCAGFLRIPGSVNPLDNSAVHPESYGIVTKMAMDLNVTVSELIANKTSISEIDIKGYISDTTGMHTLRDIIEELKKPGRDPRGEKTKFSFDENVHSIGDLHTGMVVPGIVTNITNFGAFVDVGVKHDGLVHISQLADKYVSNPNDVVKLHQQVMVKVLDVDTLRNRINLTLKT